MATVIKEAHKSIVNGLLVYIVEGEMLRWTITQQRDKSFRMRPESISTGIKYRTLGKGVERQREIVEFVAEVERFIQGGE